MEKELKVALIQTHLLWENPEANRTHLEHLIEKVPNKTQLIVLPEMFTTGFSMNPEVYAETMKGATVDWLKVLAAKQNAAICGSIMITEKDKYYNRFLFVTPDGMIQYYDKRHRFMMAGEGEKYTEGEHAICIEYLGWKIFPQICYDLRFPVFARNTVDYDILLYVANWPKTRISAWDTLLKARAIENMSYCIGVNRIGLDGNGLEYVGHSAIYDVLGDEVIFSKAEERISTVSLSKKHIETTRKKLPFLEDKDTFTLLV